MWAIETTDTFDECYDALDDTDRTSVLASIMLLREKVTATRRYSKGFGLQQYERTAHAKQRRSAKKLFRLRPREKGHIAVRRQQSGR